MFAQSIAASIEKYNLKFTMFYSFDLKLRLIYILLDANTLIFYKVS